MGSVVQACVPDEKARQRKMQKLQQTQPTQRRVGKTNIPNGGSKVETIHSPKEKNYNGYIAVSVTITRNVEGSQSSNKTRGGIREDKQQEMCHESSSVSAGTKEDVEILKAKLDALRSQNARLEVENKKLTDVNDFIQDLVQQSGPKK